MCQPKPVMRSPVSSCPIGTAPRACPARRVPRLPCRGSACSLSPTHLARASGCLSCSECEYTRGTRSGQARGTVPTHIVNPQYTQNWGPRSGRHEALPLQHSSIWLVNFMIGPVGPLDIRINPINKYNHNQEQSFIDCELLLCSWHYRPGKSKHHVVNHLSSSIINSTVHSVFPLEFGKKVLQ